MRRCAWTREAQPKDELLRLILDSEGQVHVDLLGRAPGRGIYLKAEAGVLAAALSPKGLGRLFRGQARALAATLLEGEGPAARLAELTENRAIELVALARRAGQLEIGTDAVIAALQRSERPGSTLVLARDLADGTSRTVREAHRRAPVPGRSRVFGTKARLGDMLGRGDTGVMICAPGAIADRLAAEGRRWAGLVGLGDDDVLDPPEPEPPRAVSRTPEQPDSAPFEDVGGKLRRASNERKAVSWPAGVSPAAAPEDGAEVGAWTLDKEASGGSTEPQPGNEATGIRD